MTFDVSWNIRRNAGQLMLLATLMTAAFNSSARVSGNITGSVRQRNGEPVAAAIVVISDRDGRILRTTRTNREGAFTFSALPAGSYVVQGCADPFGSSSSATVELRADSDLSQDLRISNDFPKTAQAACEMGSIADFAIRRGAHEYRGRVMTFDLNGDVRGFFRSIAMIGGFELNMDASINDRIAVHLKNIPWDLALDVVLRTLGLGSQVEGKTVRIRLADPALGQDRVLVGTVTIAGTVGEIDVQNSRTQFRVNGPNADGQMQAWPVEWESTDSLKENGIGPNTLRSGDNIIITGNITRTNRIRLISIQRPSDSFSWGYLGPIRSVPSDAVMFVGVPRQ